MPASKHREGNKARWVGVRPAHNGDQVAVSGTADHSTVVIYEVPAGKVFCLTSWTLASDNNLTGRGTLTVRDDDNVTVFDIAQLLTITGQQPSHANGIFTPPLEVPEGWDIALISDIANSAFRSTILGWVEDAQ